MPVTVSLKKHKHNCRTDIIMYEIGLQILYQSQQ